MQHMQLQSINKPSGCLKQERSVQRRLRKKAMWRKRGQKEVKVKRGVWPSRRGWSQTKWYVYIIGCLKLEIDLTPISLTMKLCACRFRLRGTLVHWWVWNRSKTMVKDWLTSCLQSSSCPCMPNTWEAILRKVRDLTEIVVENFVFVVCC